ncbi:MAG: hypothetical protein ACE5JL_12790, partial [Dehalococcoidia bacterium]
MSKSWKIRAVLGVVVLLLWFPVQGDAQQRVSFEGRTGTVLTSDGLRDLANLGATVGLGISYQFSRYFALRVDGDLGIFAGDELSGGATAPDLRLWHYGGGFEVSFAKPSYQDVPLTLSVNAGAGATTFETDEFSIGGDAPPPKNGVN